MTPSVEGIDVLISEVGPRDGLQNTKQFMPTAFKQRWISAAAAAGLREIEVCSFVPPMLKMSPETARCRMTSKARATSST